MNTYKIVTPEGISDIVHGTVLEMLDNGNWRILNDTEIVAYIPSTCIITKC